MLAGPLVFLDVDTQRDFLEPTGALYVPGSEAILGPLARLTACARTRGIPVLATACAHTLDEDAPEPFPPHCLVGTPGQGRVEATAWPGSQVISPNDEFSDIHFSHITLEKRRYDLFTHPNADRLVCRFGRSDPTFVVYGVATDYCVRAAVLGLLDRERRVAVVVDAVRAVDSSAEPAVLTDFVRRGARLILSEVVCQEGRDSNP